MQHPLKVAMTLIIVMMVVTIMVMPITSVMVMTTVNFVHMIYPVQVMRGKVFSTRPRNALLSFAPTLTRLKNSHLMALTLDHPNYILPRIGPKQFSINQK